MKVSYLLTVLLMLGCTEEVKRQPEEQIFLYSNEQEKLLNEAFLEIVGTDLCYTIEEKYLSKAQKAIDEIGEAAGRKIFDKYKIEDTTNVVLFTTDKFISKNDWHNKFTDTIDLDFIKKTNNKRFTDADTLEPYYLPYLRQLLIENNFIGKNDSAGQILDSLSLPLQISSFNLNQTGCYKIVRLENKGKIQGKFKTYGTFNCSRIYFDQANRRACFFYERNCLDGAKCAAGSLVFLKKAGNRWKVLKEYAIYQT